MQDSLDKTKEFTEIEHRWNVKAGILHWLRVVTRGLRHSYLRAGSRRRAGGARQGISLRAHCQLVAPRLRLAEAFSLPSSAVP